MIKQEQVGIRLNELGFTMAELMISIAIIGILMAIAVPNMVSQIPGAELNGAARQLLSDLMWARSKAVADNNQVVVTFPSSTSYAILDDDNNNGSANLGEWTKTQNIQTHFAHVTLAKTGADPAFSPRGTAAGATTVTVTNSSGARSVTVSVTGVVKVN